MIGEPISCSTVSWLKSSYLTFILRNLQHIGERSKGIHAFKSRISQEMTLKIVVSECQMAFQTEEGAFRGHRKGDIVLQQSKPGLWSQTDWILIHTDGGSQTSF